MRPLVILHAACHGPTLTRHRIAQACRRYRADSIEWTEAYRRNVFLRTRLRWSMVVGRSTTDRRRGPKDNPLLVRRRNKVIASGAVKGCGPSTPARIAPERWITWAVYSHPLGRVAHYALHPNAAVEGAWDSDRAAKYREQMQVLVALVEANRTRYAVDHDIISGDLNYRELGVRRLWSPKDVFDQLGMGGYWSRHLDWIAWSPGLRLVHKREIPESENGQDHPWLLATFRLNPRKVPVHHKENLT